MFLTSTGQEAEQYTYDLVERLRNDDDFYAEVVCRKYPVVLTQYRRLEIPISILPLKGVTDIDSPVRFARLLRKGKNIIHVHSFKDAFMAVMARRISENRDTRVVVSVHGVLQAQEQLHVHQVVQVHRLLCVLFPDG